MDVGHLILAVLFILAAIYAGHITLWAVRVKRGCTCGITDGKLNLMTRAVNVAAHAINPRTREWEQRDIAEFQTRYDDRDSLPELDEE